MDWMFLPLKRYADFQGRSRRKEYWMFWLLTVIIMAVLYTLLFATMPAMPQPGPDGMVDPAAAEAAMSGGSSIVFILIMVVGLALLIPSLAVTVRRLHDQDKSGWMILLGLIPLVGGLIIFIFMLLDGTRGPNRFGPDPKEVDPA